ncbi:MAG: TonB-dependent receptor [Puniceicoccaceae bacterium]
MKKQYRQLLAAAVLFPFSLPAEVDVFELQPLVVTGDLLQSPADRLPASVSILGAYVSDASGNTHFKNLLGRMPNLNWAGGTSRPRFFQIRGIGENSQFGNELPASSVGFMIDGIDFTGIGSVAGLFDVSQVEVLRGPQAAAFGANALAGMVLIETTAPTRSVQGKAEISVGDHDFYSFGAAVGGPIGDNGQSALAYRVSVHAGGDNGFRRNSFLNSDDTNSRDEKSARLKLNYAATESFELDLNLLYFDFQNGYDAWALDNDSFNTSTDEPGVDTQESLGTGLKATWHVSDKLDVSYRGSLTDSDMVYSYDWDWSNPAELEAWYGPEVYWGIDITERTREVISHDIRFASPVGSNDSHIDWAAGLYARSFEEEQDYWGVISDYTTDTISAYGQARFAIDESLSVTVAGRIEDFEIEYEDNYGTERGTKESPWGGKLAIEYRLSPEQLVYASIDRGYKAGGVNLDNDIPVDERVYGNEKLLNYEAGWRAFLMEKSLRLQATVFYMDRQDIQVDSSIQLGDGNTFALYKDNAASGTNYGMELEVEWRTTDNLRLFASLGLLETQFDKYSYVDPADGTTMVKLDGKEQAYAPGFNYAVGAEYNWENGFFLNATLEGKDDYLFDVLNNQSLAAYNLLHLRIGYDLDDWRITVWINNALDERYDVRGFFFANEPPWYDAPKKWVSEGAPRMIGVSVRRNF